MRLTYYVLPDTLTAREQYEILKKEGFTQLGDPPPGMDDEQILSVLGCYHRCTVSTAKAMIRKYGGHGFTEHIDRDGTLFETTPIRLDGNNSKFRYNRHLSTTHPLK